MINICILRRIIKKMHIPIDNETQIFPQTFFYALKNSLILMGNHAEAHGVKNIRLPQLGCGIDKLQQSKVNKILHEVFHQTEVGITVFIRRQNPMKCNSQADTEPKRIRRDNQNGLQ